MLLPKKPIYIFITLLTLFLLGTVVVLSTVVAYFGVDRVDVIRADEMHRFEVLAAQELSLQKRPELLSLLNSATFDARAALTETVEPAEMKIPKIVHMTWKSDTLPDRWQGIHDTCVAMHPDYEFKLWTDADSRDFIVQYYPWFLDTFDNYTYPIQRADVIRYFVLHRFGGVYMDLDIGCRRRFDPLLYHEVILPQTIPVGISNDLMFAAPRHPFMDLVIYNLQPFDHVYGTNYPTVMFSTGPMFLSAQYGIWAKRVQENTVRVLPRLWYGKNAPPGENGESFFDHYYGSSWHADDAGFITFLGKFGMLLMIAGALVAFVGIARIFLSRRSTQHSLATYVFPLTSFRSFEAVPLEAFDIDEDDSASDSWDPFTKEYPEGYAKV